MGFLRFGLRNVALARLAAGAEHCASELAEKQVWPGPLRCMLVRSPCMVCAAKTMGCMRHGRVRARSHPLMLWCAKGYLQAERQADICRAGCAGTGCCTCLQHQSLLLLGPNACNLINSRCRRRMQRKHAEEALVAVQQVLQGESSELRLGLRPTQGVCGCTCRQRTGVWGWGWRRRRAGRRASWRGWSMWRRGAGRCTTCRAVCGPGTPRRCGERWRSLRCRSCGSVSISNTVLSETAL